MVLWESPRQCSSWTLCEGFCWLLLLPVMLLIVARPVKLAAFPTSLSDCQTPTGWNCSGYDDRENDLFLCDTNTCKFDGECLRIGDTVTCVCQFKCNSDYVPVCGSNGESYQNECYLRQAACKQQSEILVVSEGSCATDAGSGSGDGGFSYLGRGVSLHGCSSKAQLLLLILDEGYLLTTTPPDLERGIAPLGPPVPAQPPLLGLLQHLLDH